jgi:hypothetical protein
MSINFYRPNTRKARKFLLAIKGFGGTLTAFFLGMNKPFEAAVTGLVIGGIDMLVNMFSDGTNEIVKDKFENGN